MKSKVNLSKLPKNKRYIVAQFVMSTDNKTPYLDERFADQAADKIVSHAKYGGPNQELVSIEIDVIHVDDDGKVISDGPIHWDKDELEVFEVGGTHPE